MTSKESNSRFNRAIMLLQADFKILPVGISDSGSWRYAFIYDLVHRHYPEIPEAARFINEGDARCKLAELYFQSVGAARLKDVTKIFGWLKSDVENTISQLSEIDLLDQNIQLGEDQDLWIALRKIS
jgi:hypothetical protein